MNPGSRRPGQQAPTAASRIPKPDQDQPVADTSSCAPSRIPLSDVSGSINTMGSSRPAKKTAAVADSLKKSVTSIAARPKASAARAPGNKVQQAAFSASVSTFGTQYKQAAPKQRPAPSSRPAAAKAAEPTAKQSKQPKSAKATAKPCGPISQVGSCYCATEAAAQSSTTEAKSRQVAAAPPPSAIPGSTNNTSMMGSNLASFQASSHTPNLYAAFNTGAKPAASQQQGPKPAVPVGATDFSMIFGTPEIAYPSPFATPAPAYGAHAFAQPMVPPYTATAGWQAGRAAPPSAAAAASVQYTAVPSAAAAPQPWSALLTPGFGAQASHAVSSEPIAAASPTPAVSPSAAANPGPQASPSHGGATPVHLSKAAYTGAAAEARAGSVTPPQGPKSGYSEEAEGSATPAECLQMIEAMERAMQEMPEASPGHCLGRTHSLRNLRQLNCVRLLLIIHASNCILCESYLYATS